MDITRLNPMNIEAIERKRNLHNINVSVRVRIFL